MGSLKEIKTRTQSVKSTQKITSAMKMVSSAKLRKAQKSIESFYPYEQKMSALLTQFLRGADENHILPVYTECREVRRVAIVVYSSNSSLCGGYNSNVLKKLIHVLDKHQHLGKDNILIFAVGKKIAKACLKMGYKVQGNFESMVDRPNYNDAAQLANTLLRLFQEKRVDQIEMIYHHFKSKSSQNLVVETYLPLMLDTETDKVHSLDYIIEPDAATVMAELLPRCRRLKIYTALLDSSASEHAARTIAMQTATENADELLEALSLQYNKSRQQAITNELLDIVGGSIQ